VTFAIFKIRDTKLRNAISAKTLGGFRQTIGSILLIWYWTHSIFVLDQNIRQNYEEPNIAGSKLATQIGYRTSVLCGCPQSIQVNTWVLRESRPRTACFYKYVLQLITH